MGSEQNNWTSMPCSEPKLCANNCGFWGNPTTMNLCSKCYRAFCLKEQRSATAKAAVKISLEAEPEPPSSASSLDDKADISSSSSTSTAAASPTLDEAASAPEQPQPQPQPKAANRCGGCNKKVGLTGFKCRCGFTFCGAHRYPESHDCQFDFKGAGRDAIAKANPVVKASKVDRF